MNTRSFTRSLIASALVFALSAVALADVIRMKDGQVIRGQIVAFRDQQFTVLIGSGSRGRRSRITLYMEDVESIEFESAAGTDMSNVDDAQTSAAPTARSTQPPARTSTEPRTQPSNTTTQPPATRTSQQQQPGAPTANTGSPFFPIRVRVRADNTANGWTDSGLMVRRGQRLRITASGRVSLGQGRFSTPTGLPRVTDSEKLMRNEATGALIAVIGDDNDEFIFIGAGRDFHATRDGRLFLGINEGNLNDNTGTYDALIEVEPVTSGGR